MEKENRLIKEKSPYLLQHALNPVDWYPWGNEAFDKAADEDKPVFLSIGYSTCHWCHVMEKESFEDKEISELMNKTFVSVKVDREERPDIDGIYMTVCQMLTGSGGWPLTIIMTPDKKPFFAGTYFPKESRYGRIGMKELIVQIKNLWETKRNDLLKSAGQISSVLTKSPFVQGRVLDEEIFKTAFKEYEERFDKEHGSFGNAPKFPAPHNLMFLLRYWKRYNNENALKMTEKTLREIKKGGIYDHIGFGFCRYSTDSEWLVPHFEKMLYDQALLVMAYTETYQATGEVFYKVTADEILSYVMRDMTSGDGGFYSAEDADSEGEEGKFYLWSYDEINNELGNDAESFMKYFNVKKEGNWVDSVHGTAPGTNILHIKSNPNGDNGSNEIRLKEMIESARQKLFRFREKRIHPHKDDKILTNWNGLMISAFSKASQVFNNKVYSGIAVRAADFILKHMFDNKGRLLHRYREGDAGIYANADDYSFLIAALIDLYETTFDTKYLDKALKLNEDYIENFWDNTNGGFFFTPVYGEELLTRQKEIYDGAVPSSNSVSYLNLLRVARITSEIKYEEMGEKINRLFSEAVRNYPSGYSQFLISLDFAFGPSREIIISGNDEERNFRSVIFKKFMPSKVVLNITKEDDPVISLVPYLKNYLPVHNGIKAFVCENYICNLPADNLEDLMKVLS